MRFLLGSLFLSFLLVVGCSNNQKEEEDQAYEEHQPEDAEATVVRLDRHKVFHAGIRVEPVQKKSVAIPLTLPGKVSFNERKLAEITSRVSGTVEKVRVFTNDKVSKGDVLMELYSQEYLTIQHEFLQAADRWKRTKLTAGGDTAAAKAIYQSAMRRLNVIGITPEEIQELESGQLPATYYHVHAPFNGTILESKARVGSFVQVGSELFDFADLSTLWVLADIYEKDLPSVKTGMKAIVEVGAYPDVFHGVVTTIYGVVDEKTRTVKARIEVDNKGGMLKPEMFCSVNIEATFGSETIKIPASALLGETEKHFVFVAANDTTFQKRDVRTGVETREFAEILDGLLVGEKIVVGGGFFLKSELAKETFGEEH
jgi:RND family efflux transporter MFP subunit